MAGILKRGPRNAPRFYVQFDRGHAADGTCVRSTRLLKGVENIFQARQELARVEREVAAGRDPFPEAVVVPLVTGPAGPLLGQWSEALRTRNARDDWSRITRYLQPVFGRKTVERITLPAVMTWADELSASELSAQSQRHLLGLLSRFSTWCIERPPSQIWRTFLTNHAGTLVSADFFTVPTVTFRVLFVFVVLAHHRRRVMHFNVTEHPTAVWTGQQIVEAFPEQTAPRTCYAIFGAQFRRRVAALGIEQGMTAPQSPWQNPFAERLVGSILRECLDHVIVLGERHLRRVLASYFAYYHRSRTQLSLDNDAPEPRKVSPPEAGTVVELPEVGGLHHRYERRLAA